MRYLKNRQGCSIWETTRLDIFISRRCYIEKSPDVTQIFLRNICEKASVLHLREKYPVVCLATFFRWST